METTTKANDLPKLREGGVRRSPVLPDESASTQPNNPPGSVRKDGQDGRARTRRPALSESPEFIALWAEYRLRPFSEARNALVVAYQEFVREIARRFGHRLPLSVDRGDLHIAANFGLMSAIEAFDHERGVRFESYCELRVKGALLDELRTQDWLPRPWRQRLEQQKRKLELLRAELNREPSDEEMAGAMNLGLTEYEQLFGTGLPGAPTGSMPADDGEDEIPSLDVVPDTTSDPPGEKLTRDEILRLVAQKLSEQECRIVYLRYWEGLSMREIGELANLSESRVCKIHTRLLGRLKDRFRVDQDDD